MKTRTLLSAVAALIMAVPAAAQEQNPQQWQQHGPRPRRERMTPEQQAERYVKHMDEQLDLTDKQYKKIFNLKLIEIEYRNELMQEAREARMNGGGQRPEGEGFHGGQRPEGGFQGGQRPEGGPRGGNEGFRGPRGGGFQHIELPESFVKQQDKKLLKILGQQKYDQWKAIEEQQRQRMLEMRERFQRVPKEPHGQLPEKGNTQN